MRIDSKLVAVVTGGASGLGEATVKHLSALGAKVVIADLDSDRGQLLAGSLKDAVFFRTDVSDERNVQELIDFALKTFKAVHVVVNSAGVISAGSLIYSKGVASSEELRRVLNINVVGTFNVCKLAAKAMASQQPVDGERGVIINVASVAGYEGQKGQTAYAASKGAVIAMTLPMARELGKLGIRVMTIAPGIFETPMGSGIQGKVRESLFSAIPLQRFGVPGEFAQAVKAIVESSYATGETWRLSGGIRLPYL